MSKKIVTKEGLTLIEVVDSVQKKQEKRAKKEKASQELFNRPPMITTATVSTGATLVASYFAVTAAGSCLFGAILSMVGFLGTMLAKGSRDSKYCIVLAVLNILVATALIVAELKMRGVFDWIETSIVR